MPPAVVLEIVSRHRRFAVSVTEGVVTDDVPPVPAPLARLVKVGFVREAVAVYAMLAGFVSPWLFVTLIVFAPVVVGV